jgi:hypothetical protein
MIDTNPGEYTHMSVESYQRIMQSSSINWNEAIKKEAKGLSDFSLGEVQSVGNGFIVTEKGTISRHHYYLPKYLVRGFDGKTVWFNITENQADTEFKRESPPMANEYARYNTTPGTTTDFENTVPSYTPTL